MQKVDSDDAKEFVFAIQNIVKDVRLSQSGCEVHEHGLVMNDSGASSSTPRCGRKNTPRLRKASNLAEDRKQPETVRLPCGGGDEADLECQLLVRERNRNTPRERQFSEVRRQTSPCSRKMVCTSSRRRSFTRSRAQSSHAHEQKIHKSHAYEPKIHKSHAYEQEIHKSHAYDQEIHKVMRTSLRFSKHMRAS